MAKRALVLGASGLVGRALQRTLEGNGWQVVASANRRPREGLVLVDLTDPYSLRAAVELAAPSVVFLPAGYTDVDGAEAHSDLAGAVNVEGSRHVADIAAQARALLVFYSSDYIFDGKAGPYGEDDPPNPLNVYGRTKLEAERVIQESTSEHLILRTTWVYGWERDSTNFAMNVWRKLSAGEHIQVAYDQVSTPTLADYLAEVSLRLIELEARGVVNVVGADRLPRTDFARRLASTFALDDAGVEPVATADMKLPANRPLEAGLKTDRLRMLLTTDPMDLSESLKRVRRRWRAETYVEAGPAETSSEERSLKAEILQKVREYHGIAHQSRAFKPMASRVPYSGRVYGPEEIVNLVDASLDFWLTLGPWGDRFEKTLKQRLGCRDVALVNSGSSANLTAITALMAAELDQPLRPGDEVITPAVTFPTTIAPLLQNGLVPVLVDCELQTLNINPHLIEDAISDRTRAIMLPHTLGNPCDMDVIGEIVRRKRLYLIEDSCDALGSRFNGRPVGTFGDLATVSFYPAHQITMGEGGAVIVNRPQLSRIVRSVRDWGRDCWCAPGESNTCGKRFGWQLGGLPSGYDHKYVYSRYGYNLKPTDMQAAIGVAQLDRLDQFVARRQSNFAALYAGLSGLAEWLILPRLDDRSDPAWFGFPIIVQDHVSRRALVQWLEESNVETRTVFGGNILKQPAYQDARVRIHGGLGESDRILRDAFFVGVYPGLTQPMIEFVIERVQAFFRQH